MFLSIGTIDRKIPLEFPDFKLSSMFC